MDITVFLGAPGSGKGTQAKRLAQRAGFVHFSTGDMLRAAIKAGDPVGLKAKQSIDRGELVADDVMIALIEKALTPLSPKSRVILDGFPRTVAQASALDAKPSTRVAHAVYFVLNEDKLIERLTGRRICSQCGESYHVRHLRSKVEGRCERCGGDLVQRSDDSEEVVRHRLKVFVSQNTKLLEYYGAAKRLQELNADAPVETIQNSLLKILG